MLTDGILDQLAKYERAKAAEKTHRSLLQKTREGKVIRGPKANYSFKYNDTEDGLLIHQPEMRIVEKIFRMAASGIGSKAMQTRLYAEARSCTWAGSYLSSFIGTAYHRSTQECGAREVLQLFSIVCLQSTSLLAQQKLRSEYLVVWFSTHDQRANRFHQRARNRELGVLPDPNRLASWLALGYTLILSFCLRAVGKTVEGGALEA